jgi:hypothetical protein
MSETIVIDTDKRTLRDSLREAVVALQRAAVNAQTLAEHYRKYDLSRGHQGLTELSAELRLLAMRVVRASGPLGIDLSAPAEGGSLTDHIGNLVAVLETLISAQASEDWVTVADILEYDVEPAIRQWATVLESLS